VEEVAYLFNPYGVRECYPEYFGDFNLEIKKDEERKAY